MTDESHKSEIDNSFSLMNLVVVLFKGEIARWAINRDKDVLQKTEFASVHQANVSVLL